MCVLRGSKAMDTDRIQDYWQAFLATLPSDSPYRNKTYVSEGWGDGPEMADELGALIAAGTKTATCSALWEWEAEGESPPETGTVTIVLDGRGRPLCIVETTEVTVRKYNEVDANFAREEGEGDLSLEYWREAHKNFFSRYLPKIGREFSEDMPLVCERFRLIYK
ncbi:MAG: ASCH domain-containing protein [Anaerolineales bacterium]